MTLYLKYRPQLIDELDLESVRTSLKNIILSGNIPHAFLFSGPKGTGKTSAARILAKIINCEKRVRAGRSLGEGLEPCNTCDSCVSITGGTNIDIIELDAASNRGIDDIRSLKDGIYLSPVNAKAKIYIIDEAHMLTLEAANAFLKTLEEPPAHVYFILATTNPEKLPATVISRLTQVNFTKATDEDISRQLTRVTKGEEIKIGEDAVKKISKLADGSFRDAVKILENLSFKTKDIKLTDLDNLFPNSSSKVNEFLEILTTKDTKKALEFIEALVQNGISIKNFTDEIIESIHKSILAKNGIGIDLLTNFNLDELLKLNSLISESKKLAAIIPQLPLEIAIIKFIGEPKETIEVKIEPPKEEIKEIERIKLSGKNMDPANWQKLLDNTRSKNFGIEALLRAAKPLDYDGESLVLGLYYKFHKEKLEDMKNTKIVEELCKETFALDSIKIIYELIDKPVTRQPVIKDLSAPADKDIIDAAKEIFG